MPSGYLTSQAVTIRSRVRRLWRIEQFIWVSWALAWTAGSVLLFTALVAIVDYGARPRDLGLRTMLTFVWLVGLVAIARFWHRRLLKRWPANLTEWAEHCEQCFPELGSRLSTAAAFLRAGQLDPSHGSRQLQAALLHQVAIESATVPLRHALAWPTAARAILLLIAMVAIVIPASRSNALVATAARRLALPWQPVAWPQKDLLVVIEAPEAIGSGETFVIKVKNRRRGLPRNVRFEMRPLLADRAANATAGPTSTYLMARDGNVAVLRLEGVVSSFAFRVTGGDDRSMSWRIVHVVEDPRWRVLERLVLPPAYAQLPPAETAAAIQAFEGSTVTIVGETSRTLSSVAVLTDTAADEYRIELRSQNGGRRWVLAPGEWQLQRSGTYQIQYADASGFSWTGEPIPVKVVPDQPPSIDIVLPGLQDPITPRSTVAIAADFRDDLGLQRCGWRITWEGKIVGKHELNLGSAEDAASAAGSPLRQEATMRDLWQASTAQLTENTTLHVVFFAEDCRGQYLESEQRPLVVVSAEQLLRRLQRMQDHIALRLAEAHDAQQQAIARMAEIRHGRSESDATREQTAAAARRLQVQVSHVLWEHPQSATRTASELERLISQHQLSAPTVAALVRSFLLDAERTARPLESAIASQWPSAEQLESGGSQFWQPLADAQEEMADWLSRWSNRWGRQRDMAQLRSALDDLRRRQQELLTATEQTRLQQLTQPQDSALEDRLQNLARDQEELARAWEKWRANADTVLRANSASGEQSIRELDGLGIGAAMATAADELHSLRMGTAARSQRAAIERLADAIDLLSNRASSTTSPPVTTRRTIAALAKALHEWTRDQRRLRGQTEQWHHQTMAEPPATLIASQQRLRLEIQLAQEQLELHPSLRALLGRVTRRMREAEQSLQSRRGAEALASQDQALLLLQAMSAALTAQAAPDHDPQRNQQRQAGQAGYLPPPAVLQLLQEQLLEETRAVDAERRRTGLTPRLARRIQALATEQAKLAEWVEQAVESANARPESNSPDQEGKRP